jgi:hypothetical protein
MSGIATIVSIMGDDAYFKMATVSIASFLKNNTSADLFIFTDNIDKVSKLKNISPDRVHIVDMLDRFKECEEMIKDLSKKGCSEEEMQKHADHIGHFHRQIFVGSLVPIAEGFFKDKKYSHILKIDVDSYFAGGDMMQMVEEEIKKAPEFDLYLVKRTHDLMCHYAKGAPGTGFMLWRKESDFAPRYVEQYARSFQVTILKLRSRNLVRTKILSRPGYHFVYPFEKAKRINKEFTKEIASEFLPAYFHLLGSGALENIKIMDGWFGGTTDEAT